MYEATQRRLVRLTFLVGCVAPTLGTFGWAVAWSLPSHSARVERQLCQLTGLAVRVDQVVHPTPRVTRLDGLQLIDPESRERLVSVDTLTILRTADSYELLAGHVDLDAEDRARIWQLVRAHLVEHDALQERSVRFFGRSVTFAVGSRQHVLHVLRGTMEASGPRSTIAAEFRLEPADSPALHVNVTRDRSQFPLQTRVELSSNDQALPIGLLSQTAHDRFGAACTFSGTLRSSLTDDKWLVQLAGQVREIECDRLLVAPLLCGVEGKGEIVLEHATIGPQGIQGAVGQLRIREGVVDTSLVRAMVSHYLAMPDAAIDLSAEAARRLSFRELAVGVRMDSQGVTIKGLCNAAGDRDARAAVVGADGPILWGPENSQLPYYMLARSLVPSDVKDAARIAGRIQQYLPRYMPAHVKTRRVR